MSSSQGSHPLDFEEFLWANGIYEEFINLSFASCDYETFISELFLFVFLVCILLEKVLL